MINLTGQPERSRLAEALDAAAQSPSRTTPADLVPVFASPLGLTLLAAERAKGSPLTPEEAFAIRDRAPCIMLRTSDAEKVIGARTGDLDPEKCWVEFQELRRGTARE